MDEEGSYEDSSKDMPGASSPDTASGPNATTLVDGQAQIEAEHTGLPDNSTPGIMNGMVRTLDGDVAGDEMEMDAMNYQILLGKIDGLLDKLRLDA